MESPVDGVEIYYAVYAILVFSQFLNDESRFTQEKDFVRVRTQPLLATLFLLLTELLPHFSHVTHTFIPVFRYLGW